MRNGRRGKSASILSMVLLGVLLIGSNASALPGPPWLDFGSYFMWDGTTLSSGFAGQPTVGTIVYQNGTEISPPLTDTILHQVVDFNLSFDGVANDTISIGSFFSADLVEGAAFNPMDGGTWNIGFENIVVNTTLGSRWADEYSVMPGQRHLILQSTGGWGSSVNATGKLVPEPGALALFAIGAIGLFLLRRPRKASPVLQVVA